MLSTPCSLRVINQLEIASTLRSHISTALTDLLLKQNFLKKGQLETKSFSKSLIFVTK